MELRYINEILLGKKIFEIYCKKKDFLRIDNGDCMNSRNMT